jgi:hypothetical protein
MIFEQTEEGDVNVKKNQTYVLSATLAVVSMQASADLGLWGAREPKTLLRNGSKL